MTRRTPDLGQALVDLEAAVKAGDPEKAKTLRPAATAAALAKLAKVAGALGPEAEAWFRWHDGQKGSASLGPSTNVRLMSAAESASAWKFLAEEGHEPLRASWLPLMENGAGDYVMLDRDDGQLIHYYHDEKARPKAASSIAAWAVEVARDWRQAIASLAPAAVPKGWQRVEPPTQKQLSKKPAGTAFHYRATEKVFGKGEFFHLLYKKGPDAWYTATNATLELCWTAISNNLLPFQAFPDLGAANWLGRDKVFRDGKDAPNAGLYEQHFARPPFPKK